ncbi:uncharacterized protein SCDLUD_003981 [Saccharomycodes ludwigii]|uniref:uncharacterized protein n=1 Tax=Saccharomycodes ludwigii TaxID=36035 RepID=UPI001E83BF47|nr:hypothetical protein SCDLUD_003981 [Saccharomycodes ludwigii]KAH3899696.1 hypothetical protein SCDLUD_003981 [Saccharomycodes ludwigii]
MMCSINGNNKKSINNTANSELTADLTIDSKNIVNYIEKNNNVEQQKKNIIITTSRQWTLDDTLPLNNSNYNMNTNTNNNNNNNTNNTRNDNNEIKNKNNNNTTAKKLIQSYSMDSTASTLGEGGRSQNMSITNSINENLLKLALNTNTTKVPIKEINNRNTNTKKVNNTGAHNFVDFTEIKEGSDTNDTDTSQNKNKTKNRHNNSVQRTNSMKKSSLDDIACNTKKNKKKSNIPISANSGCTVSNEITPTVTKKKRKTKAEIYAELELEWKSVLQENGKLKSVIAKIKQEIEIYTHYLVNQETKLKLQNKKVINASLTQQKQQKLKQVEGDENITVESVNNRRKSTLINKNNTHKGAMNMDNSVVATIHTSNDKNNSKTASNNGNNNNHGNTNVATATTTTANNNNKSILENTSFNLPIEDNPIMFDTTLPKLEALLIFDDITPTSGTTTTTATTQNNTPDTTTNTNSTGITVAAGNNNNNNNNITATGIKRKRRKKSATSVSKASTTSAPADTNIVSTESSNIMLIDDMLNNRFFETLPNANIDASHASSNSTSIMTDNLFFSPSPQSLTPSSTSISLSPIVSLDNGNLSTATKQKKHRGRRNTISTENISKTSTTTSTKPRRKSVKGKCGNTRGRKKKTPITAVTINTNDDNDKQALKTQSSTAPQQQQQQMADCSIANIGNDKKDNCLAIPTNKEDDSGEATLNTNTPPTLVNDLEPDDIMLMNTLRTVLDKM